MSDFAGHLVGLITKSYAEEYNHKCTGGYDGVLCVIEAAGV